MNYSKISHTLKRYDPFLSSCSLKANNAIDIKAGLEYLVKDMSLYPPEIYDEMQAGIAFFELVATHFISDKQCGVIGRIPIKLSYQHLSASYMKIHHNAHPAWRYQNQIISDVQELFSCGSDSCLKTLSGIYRKICLYISDCDKHYDRKEVKQFLAATVSMKNVLQYAENLIETSWNDSSPIFTFIKILADKITLDSVMNLLTTNYNPNYPQIESFFMEINRDLSPKYNIEHEVFQAFCMNPKAVTTVIDLAKNPVLTFPWDHQRLIDNMRGIGIPGNPWNEDTINHAATLYLPIGVTFVHSGLHSAFTGMAKSEGTLHITTDSRHKVVDISVQYDLLQFDGTNYLIAGSDVIAGTAMSFEFGCIFEIGRMLHEKGICFKDLYKIENKNQKE